MQVIGVATKVAAMTAMRDVVADGTIEILSASNQVLAIIGLSATGGSVAAVGDGAVWTLQLDAAGETLGLAAAGVGTSAASARIKTAGGVVQETLTVSLTGGSGDLQLVNLSISSGQKVEITSATISWP